MGRSILGMSAAVLAALFMRPVTSQADSFYNNVPVTSGLLLRLDASNTASINAGSPMNGVNVSNWANSSSGAASAATQGTAARQPIWMQSVSAINNRSAVDFSGAFDGTGDQFSVSGLNPGTGMTAFVVALYQSQTPASATGGSSLRPLFGPQGEFPSNGTYALTLRNSTEGAGLFGYRGNTALTTSTPAIDNNFHIFVLRSNNTLTELFNNSPTAYASGLPSSTQNPTLTDYFIGGGSGGNESRHYDGQMAELLMYSGALSNAEIDQIGGFLAWKYGLTTAFTQFEPPPPLTPEPGTCLLFGIAVLGAGIVQWRRIRARN